MSRSDFSARPRRVSIGYVLFSESGLFIFWMITISDCRDEASTKPSFGFSCPLAFCTPLVHIPTIALDRSTTFPIDSPSTDQLYHRIQTTVCLFAYLFSCFVKPGTEPKEVSLLQSSSHFLFLQPTETTTNAAFRQSSRPASININNKNIRHVSSTALDRDHE